MSAREIFGLIVRAAGLWLMLEFIQALPLIVTTHLDVLWELLKLNIGIFLKGLVQISPVLLKPVVGFYCLKGAPHLLRIAYPSETNPTQ